MPSPNPIIARQLREAKEELARLCAEKRRLFPPNPYPFAQTDRFPREATPAQIQRRNELVAGIEALEHQIEELEARLYAP